MDSLGVAARPATSVRATPDPSGLTERYGCMLDRQPSHLVPTRLLGSLVTDTRARPLVLHPRTRLDDWALDDSIATSAAIHRDPWTLWVHCDGTGATWPYLLGEPSAAAVTTLATGDADVTEVVERSPRAAARLRAIGALVTPSEIEADRADWDRAIGSAAEAFTNGYAALGGLVPPFHLACLRARYRRLVRRGSLRLGDTQSSRRYVAHNEPAARFFHAQLAPVVSRIVGREVKPSYVYLASYCAGAELPPHVDRAQCEYTLAMCVDFTPEPRRETSWPLQLETPDGRVVVYQALGDALVYKGRELPHFRDPLARGRTSTSLFFHYVDADFAGRLV